MMHQSLVTLSVVSWLMLGMATPSWAIQIRDYEAARHDRFTGFPATPAWNGAAWYPSGQYSGVGWGRDDAPYSRQFALVSPRHLVWATHYELRPGTVIRFLNSDGVTVDRSVSLLTPIKNELNQNSDLTLVTLASPLLASDKVKPFPYLNLADENAYIGTSLTVFGWQTKAGNGVLAMFDDLMVEALPNTRLMRFDYPMASGGRDDVYLEIGDSGSPTFAMAGGTPALLGTHTTIDANATTRFNYDTFIPHYIANLNAVMAADGYQMMPVYPRVVSLEAAATLTPPAWRKANPGSCRFDLTNASSNDATNVTLALRFPPTAMPTTLTAPGWIITAGAPGEQLLRSATLAATAVVSVTAQWLDLGTADSLNIELVLASDGCPQRIFAFNQTLAPSYNAWAAGLADKGFAADPDGDGIANLLEYAFGGDPAVASQAMPSGVALLPALHANGGVAVTDFPVREDAGLRGLTYGVEFSTTLEAGSWSLIPPPGFVLADAAFDPAVPGFLRRALAFDANDPMHFCRVKVELNESP